MDFENLFSKPPNPALGKKTAPASEERINDETEDTDIEETHEEKVKLEYKQIRPKSKHFGNSVTPQKRSPCQKSRSKDYDAYSDDSEACGQASEDNFAEELKRYIKAKEMANATQPSLLPGESVTKEMAKGTQQTVKQKNKKFKAGHKNGKQKKTKKAKRKRAGARNKESSALPRKSGSQEEDGQPKEKQQCVKLSQGFINQHTVERKGKQICKYFLERKCIKGDQCKFHHDAELEKKQEMCKFYVQGYCNRGEHCLYLHNEYPCKFYHTGTKCYQGEHCRFSHAPLTPETQELLARVLDTEKQS